MAKYEVTPQLAYVIRTARTQKKISSKSIAEHLNKSQAYMSKLEKCEIKTIDEKDLSSILLFIFKDENNMTPSLESILESIYSILSLQYDNIDIARQLWLCDYDTVARVIPLPEPLIQSISAEMKKLNLTSVELCRRINANEGIAPEIDNIDKCSYNEWHSYSRPHHKEYIFIRLQISEYEVAGILSGEVDSANYVLLYAISYYLHKIKQYGSQVIISEEESNNLINEAISYLNQFQFYSIAEKYRLTKKATRQNEQNRLLSSLGSENQELIIKILDGIKFFSELDKAKNNRYLSSFEKNLDWDLGFIFSLVGLNFYELDDLSYSRKSQLITEIYQLIQKYQVLPEQQKTLDLYDLP